MVIDEYRTIRICVEANIPSGSSTSFQISFRCCRTSEGHPDLPCDYIVAFLRNEIQTSLIIPVNAYDIMLKDVRYLKLVPFPTEPALLNDFFRWWRLNHGMSAWQIVLTPKNLDFSKGKL